MLKGIKGAIFDLDGTLIDSMWVWEKIDYDFLSKRNLTFPDDLRVNIEHLSFVEVAKYFKHRFNLNENIEDIMQEWNDMAYSEYSTNVLLKPHAREFLLVLKSMNIRTAIATSNSRLLMNAALKNNGITDMFDAITTLDEAGKVKNSPEIYLLSAKRLNVQPSECIVFEDILPAVKGAKAAGMKVIGVHDSYSEFQKEDIMRTADKYISDFQECLEAI